MKLLFVYVLQGQVSEDAGIVNEYVRIAELLLGLAEEAINLFGRGHASLHSDGFSAGRFDFSNDTICAFSVRVVVHGNAAPSFASDNAMPARFLSRPRLLMRSFHQAFPYFQSSSFAKDLYRMKRILAVN